MYWLIVMKEKIWLNTISMDFYLYKLGFKNAK